MSRDLSIRLVVFDWAGTVIDFGSRAPAAAFVELFAGRGVPVTEAEARGPMGTHKKDHLLAMLNDTGIRRRWAERHGRDWSADDVEAMYRDLVPLQLATVERHADLVPGAVECAAELRAMGVRLGGATGYFHEANARVLEAARRQGYAPDAAVCGDDVPAGRPAPWMIYRLMEAVGVYPPSSVLKVGDTRVDIEEGRNAGCWSAGVTSSSSEIGLSPAEYAALPPEETARRTAEVRRRFEAGGAHAVVEALHEVPALVARLNERLASGERP
jgi:phosphonoacetaldehyde hydrolase